MLRRTLGTGTDVNLGQRTSARRPSSVPIKLSDPAHTVKSNVTDTPDEPLAPPIDIAVAPEQPAADGDDDHSMRPEGLFVPPPQIDEYRIRRPWPRRYGPGVPGPLTRCSTGR